MPKENRRSRIKRLTTPAGMKRAALIHSKRKGNMITHRYVLGGMKLIDRQIVLQAVEQGPGMNIIRPIQLTADAFLQYRWRTKQAAHQFMNRHELKDMHVFSVHRLDVLPPAR